MWDGPIDYEALLASLTQLDNPEACFFTRIQTLFMENHTPQRCLNDLTSAADGGHNLAAYLVALLLYRHNGAVGNDDTVRRYKRWFEGKEGSRAVAGGGGRITSRWLSNNGCVMCRRPAIKLIYQSTWGMLSLPPSA